MLAKNEIIVKILTDLEIVKENLLSLSDELWQSIDHNDPDALEEGVAFKREYNSKMIDFDRLSTDISTLVQQFTSIKKTKSSEDYHNEHNTSEENQRIIRDLNQEEPHTVDEDYIYKRPFGFIIRDRAFQNVDTWRQVLETMCLYLSELKPDIFQRLPESSSFVSTRGNSVFSRDPLKLRYSSLLKDGIYVEVNLSANNIMGVIRLLLKEFGVSKDEVKIFLRQDRDA